MTYQGKKMNIKLAARIRVIKRHIPISKADYRFPWDLMPILKLHEDYLGGNEKGQGSNHKLANMLMQKQEDGKQLETQVQNWGKDRIHLLHRRPTLDCNKGIEIVK